MQGVPAIAVSLDNYKALTPEGFMAGAAYVVALTKARNTQNCRPCEYRMFMSHAPYTPHIVVVN